MSERDEDELLRDVALRNASSILQARNRAEAALVAAKEELREQAERMNAMFHHAAVGIATADVDGRFIEVNRRFAEIVGYPPDELTRRTFSDITHEADRAATSDHVRLLLSGEIPEYVMDKRYCRRDGSTVWSRTRVTLLRDAAGEPDRMIGVIEDITSRKAAEETLHDETRVLELLYHTGTMLASELELRTLLQAVTDATTSASGARFGAFFYNTVDAQGAAYMLYTLSGAPREAFEQFGHPRATALFGHTFRGEGALRSDDVTTDPRYGQMSPHYGMPRGHLPVRSYLAVPVISRSGEVIGGLFFGHPDPGVFTARSERLVVGVAAQAAIAIDNARLYDAAQRATADREQLLESERSARTAAERLSALKDEFLATLSHELRTPLSAILGWSQVLRHGARDPELVRGLETIERNARVQKQLIEDLLDMSRITSGKLHLEVEPLHPSIVVEAAIETVRPAADAKRIRIETALDTSVGLVSGDAHRLQQVVWNLLSNAVKFTSSGGVVRVVQARVGTNVEIAVTDTGIGVSPEFLAHAFDRFRQGDGSMTRDHGGLGLGLSIVRHLVELHGGVVRIASEGIGHGTTVTVSLPLRAVQEQRGGKARADVLTPVTLAGPHNSDLRGIRVLVVDDQEDARHLVSRVLIDCGAEVLATADPAQVLRLVESRRPHVLVSDIGMPGVDGYELLRRVRGLGPSRGGALPAIALTAFARVEDRARALDSGFAAHLTKPVEIADLVANVAIITGRASATAPGEP